MPNLESYVFLIAAVAVLLAAAASVWLLVQAFRASVWWGLVVLLFPPAALVFIPTHWKQSRAPLSLFLFAAVVAAAGLVVGQLPESRDPRVKLVENENGVKEKHITLTRVEGGDYSFVTKHPDIVVLQIANKDVTDETLGYVVGLVELRELDISDTQVTDAGLASLAKLPKLRSLRLANTAVTAQGFEKHLAGLPELAEIDLSGCKAITSLKGQDRKDWRKIKDEWRAARKDKNPRLLDQ